MSFVAATFVLRVTIVSALALPLVVCRAPSDDISASSSSNAAATDAPRTAYDFINSIGANTHINYFDRKYGDFPMLERELKSIGILHLRDGVHLQNDDYNHAVYNRWIELGKSGIRFDAVVDPRSTLPTLSPALFDKVNTLAGHTIESFEGANELDIGKLPDWTSVDRTFQASLYQAVASMPDRDGIKVVGPSLAFARKGLLLGDLSAQLDEGNLHPYPAGKMPSVVFPEQTLMAKMASGTKPVVITETGYHNALNDHTDQPAVSETAAAKYIPRLFLENFARDISRTYLYEFLDEKSDPELKDNQLHWGLVRADGSEKPAFTALKNLIALLKDANEPSQTRPLSWSLSVNDSNVHHLLLQQSSGEFDLILWQEVPSYDTKAQQDIAVAPESATVTLAQPAKRITAYEPSVQAAALKSVTNTTQLQFAIPDSPIVLKIVP